MPVILMGSAYLPDDPKHVFTVDNVNDERDRRRAVGFKFPDASGKYYQARADDMNNINTLSNTANVAIASGKQEGDLRWNNPDKDFAFIAADNSTTPMDAMTMVMLGQAASKYVDAVNMAARSLKDRILAGEKLKSISEDALWP